WLQKRPNSVASDHLDLQAAKKTKLANLLLDSRENMEADIEAILYHSPFIGRTNNWLQLSKKFMAKVSRQGFSAIDTVASWVNAEYDHQASAAVGLTAYKSWKKFPFSHLLLRWKSSKPSPTSKTILVAPLTPQRGLTPPLNLFSSQHSIRLVSNFDIPGLNKKSTIRRAEYSCLTDPTRHSLDVRCNRIHQQALYEFALVTCLGVNSAASCASLLLDLACGVLLPFGGHDLTKNVPLKLGLDQFVRPKPGIDFAQCSLVGSRLPLR
ncbi:hypothetical protein TSMEX_009838, partial [Taenia solium]